ncbi:MAG: hypothetical protein QM756_17580 [Polyangiaceae bacterium]
MPRSPTATFQIFFGDERFDLALALDDQAQCHRLHAACAQAESQLGPNQRRNVVAHDTIEHAASALRVIEVLVELTRVLEPLLDALLGDLLELDAPHFELRPTKLLRDVPGDGLTFAIRVGCEQDDVGLFGFVLELVEDLGLGLDHLIGLFEALLDVDAHALGQVFDVALTGKHLIAGTKILLDGLGLGGGLDDYEGLGHGRVFLLREFLNEPETWLPQGGEACAELGPPT